MTKKNETPGPIPVIYELNEYGEATGTVHFFCSIGCRSRSHYRTADFDYGETPAEHVPTSTRCEVCGVALEVPPGKTSTSRKFYKTTITVEVLSEEPYNPGSLLAVAYDIVHGDHSGVWEVSKTEVLTPAEAARALEEQGSDPSFFQLNPDGTERFEEDAE